jgi:hypothetical protein
LQIDDTIARVIDDIIDELPGSASDDHRRQFVEFHMGA